MWIIHIQTYYINKWYEHCSIVKSTMSHLSKNDIQSVGVSVGNSLRFCIEMCEYAYYWCTIVVTKIEHSLYA